MTIQNVEVLLILDQLPALLVLTFNLLPVPALSTFPHQFLPSFGIGGGVAKILHRCNFWIYTKITTS